jgi:phage baseplate assembly protein W
VWGFLFLKNLFRIYLWDMADGKTYGINFPFRDSPDGKYLSLSQTPEEEIRTDLLHLLLTRKGSRYYLPDFGTRLYEFIFEPMDVTTFDAIKADIKNAVAQFIPNLTINQITVQPYLDDLDAIGELNMTNLGVGGVYRIPGRGTEEYTAKIRIDFTADDAAFGQRDFIIINI